MRTDNLQQYVNLRRELAQEKEQLSRRLAQISEALGSGVTEKAQPASERTGAKPGRKPAGGGQSLREHVFEVLRGGDMTREEVLIAVQNRGYIFSTNNPLNSLGVILYGKNPKFNRVDGKFSLGSSTGATKAGGTGVANSKRQMSPAARARIAEAQRKRWAKAKAGKSRL